MEFFQSLKLDLSQCPMRGGLLDLIGVWVLGKEKGREIEKEREGYCQAEFAFEGETETEREEYGICVCIGYCLEVEDYWVFFGEKQILGQT